jgi:hypothetical protein
LLSFVGRVESLAFGGDACGSVSGGAISVIAERCFDSFAGDSNLAVREAVVTAEPAALDVDGMKSRQVSSLPRTAPQEATKIEVRVFWAPLDATKNLIERGQTWLTLKSCRSLHYASEVGLSLQKLVLSPFLAAATPFVARQRRVGP